MANTAASASIQLTHLGLTQIAWIARVNGGRATYDASALVFDGVLTQGAKTVAAYLVAHNAGPPYDLCFAAPSGSPAGCSDIQTKDRAVDDNQSVSSTENTAGTSPASGYAVAEAAFMGDSVNCSTQPATYLNGAYSTTAPINGHFLHVICRSQVFVGLNEYNKGDSGRTADVANLFVEAVELNDVSRV